MLFNFFHGILKTIALLSGKTLVNFIYVFFMEFKNYSLTFWQDISQFYLMFLHGIQQTIALLSGKTLLTLI